MLARSVAVAGVLARTAGVAPPTSAIESTAIESCAVEFVRSGAGPWVCVEAETGQRLAESARSGRLSTDPLGDRWCAFGKHCEGHRTPYDNWRKVPAAFGDENGVVGRFDVVFKVVLKHRTPVCSVTLIHRGGKDPAVTAFDARVVCSEDEFFVDRNCGEHYFPDRQIAPGRRVVTDEAWGNRLRNADSSFASHFTKVKVAGNTREWSAPRLQSNDLHCPKEPKRCYFPGQ